MQLAAFTRIHCIALLIEWYYNKMFISQYNVPYLFLLSRLNYRKVLLIENDENDGKLRIELWD